MNIVILGGGTAGWLTALFAKKTFPEYKTTLIQSKELGIIGVGEASTPHLVTFMKNLDLDIPQVVLRTNGSIKNGINFVNWNGDGKRYFHSFKEEVTNTSVDNSFTHDCIDYYIKMLIQDGRPLEEFVYAHNLSYKNRIDFEHLQWSLHFDATRLADYLEEVGKERGIEVIDDSYLDAEVNENGNIKTLILKNQKVDVDFVFDCTGFHRQLIGKLYKQKWISFSKHLPMKKAIPFWIDTQTDIEPYTSCIAMKYGWVWHIPLYHRTGCGYIFDSDYIDVEQAKKEAEEYFGQSLEIRKIIDFEAGMYENFWVKNCMAVGLSSSFLEPLESTSLWITCQQLELFRHFTNDLFLNRDRSLSQFNKIITTSVDEVMQFIFLHYYTKRQDSDFWREFKDKNEIPPKLIDRIEAIKDANFRSFDIVGSRHSMIYFNLSSWLSVCKGLEMFESPMFNDHQSKVKPTAIEYREIFNKLMKENSENTTDFLKRIHGDENV